MSALALIKKTPHMLAAGFALSLAFSGSALALDAKAGAAFIDTVQDGLKPYGLSMSHNGLNVQGDSIILTNVRLLQQQEQLGAPSLPIYLGTVRFENVKPAADGSYNVAEIRGGEDAAAAVKAASADDKAGEVIISGLQVAQARISAKGNVNSLAQYLPYEKSAIKSISYNLGGKTILSLSDLSSEYAKKSDGIYSNSSKVGAFVYDPASWPGEDGKDAKEMLSSLGYENIKGHFEAAGIWNPQQGKLDIAEYKLTADNMGSLALSGKFSGISQDFANTYQKLALAQMENSNPSPAQQQQMSSDALALAAQLKVNNFSILYKDNSLIGRALDYMSKTTAQPRAEMVSILKAGILANTQNFQDKVFATHVANEIDAFLDNPQSLQVTAKPQQPASLFAIMQALGVSPDNLINLLGLDIKANK